MDEEMKEVLEKEQLDRLTEEDFGALEKAGFITDMDEKKVLSHQLKSVIYSPNIASFSILPTYACNLQCPYCYEGSGNIRREVMNEDMVNQVIQGMKAFCSETGVHQLGLTLYGGEPLLHAKASLKIVTTMGEWAQNTGMAYNCSMITNGTLLTEKVLQDFEPFLKMIQVTLDGPQDYHDTRRIQKTGEGTYDTIMKAVELARDRGILVMVRIQVATDNVDMLGDLFSDFRERGFNKDEGIKAYLFPLMEINDVCSSYASLCSEEEAQMLPGLWRKAREYELELVGKPIQISVSPYCSFAAKNSFLIDPLGDVYTCVSVVGDPAYKVAHMSEKGLTGITPEFYRFTVRSPTDIALCSDCVLLPLCGGGCAHRAYQKHGTYQAGDCTLHKGLEEEKLVLYLENRYPDWFR
jgi:uncharacterized protein